MRDKIYSDDKISKYISPWQFFRVFVKMLLLSTLFYLYGIIIPHEQAQFGSFTPSFFKKY